MPPDMVASYTLEGSTKPQFLQNFEKPRLIEKSAVVLHAEATASLKDPQFSAYLNVLPNLPISPSKAE